MQDVGVTRKLLEELSFVRIGCADLDAVKFVQNVELGDRQDVGAVQHRRIAGHHRVEPAASTPAVGSGAEPVFPPGKVAPHLAAEAVGVRIDIEVIEQAWRCLAAESDQVLVEGVGGWLVPISQRQTMADVALALGLPVIMVVGVTLGCINHALLTAAAVQSAGLRLAGWIANRVDPECQTPDAVVRALGGWLAAPLLADIAYQSDGAVPAGLPQQIDIVPLLG